jgi:hypothetical protein
MVNFSLLKQRLLRLTKGGKTHQDSCDRCWTICPAEEESSFPPAIYAEGDLEKITGLPPDCSYLTEVERLRGTRKYHAATVAYQFFDVSISHGYVYKGAMKYPFSDEVETWFTNCKREIISDALIASSVYTSRYFGHWLTEALPLSLIAESMAVSSIVPSQKVYKHQLEYNSLLRLSPLFVAQAQCGKLTIVDDFSQNSFKRERYIEIRDRIKSIKSLHSNHGVMFLRKNSGQRRFLINEMEVADFLRGQGFIIIDAEKASVEEIARQALGAKVVIGVEGSQLTQGFFMMSDTGTILALQPPDRFSTIHKDFTDSLGMRYGFLVGDQVPSGFTVNIDHLAMLLEKVGY